MYLNHDSQSTGVYTMLAHELGPMFLQAILHSTAAKQLQYGHVRCNSPSPRSRNRMLTGRHAVRVYSSGPTNPDYYE